MHPGVVPMLYQELVLCHKKEMFGQGSRWHRFSEPCNDLQTVSLQDMVINRNVTIAIELSVQIGPGEG